MAESPGSTFEAIGKQTDQGVETSQIFNHLLIRLQAVLELFALGHSTDEVLPELLHSIEGLIPGLYSSILYLDDQRRLRHGWAPGLPEAYSDVIDGLAIGPAVGSCGTAAFTEKRVVVTDTFTDPLWVDFVDVAKRYGLRACWSEPIRSSTGEVLGTFAMYYGDVRAPSEIELQIIQKAAHLAGVVLERDRKEKSVRALEQKLFELDKLAALGNLAGGIAHDLNNTLTVIEGHLEILKFNPNLHSKCERSVLKALDGCANASHLIEQVLGFAGKGKYHPVRVSLRNFLEETLEFLTVSIKKGVQVVLSCEDHQLEVLLDKQQMRRVFTNLLFNAQDFMPAGGMIHLTVCKTHVTPEAILESHMTAGDYVVISVRDEGVGMDPEIMDRIFEPFFTTREHNEGSGLGLATAFGIVRHHGGWIDVASEVERGTEFLVYLPQSNSSPVKSDRELDDEARDTISKKVLLIDDDRRIVDTLTQVLQFYNFEVIGFSEPKEALHWFADHTGEVSAVLLDMRMPEMGGEECFRHIRDLTDEIPVILTSGYCDDKTVRALLEQGAERFVSKPIDYRQLANMLVECVRDE